MLGGAIVTDKQLLNLARENFSIIGENDMGFEVKLPNVDEYSLIFLLEEEAQACEIALSTTLDGRSHAQRDRYLYSGTVRVEAGVDRFTREDRYLF